MGGRLLPGEVLLPSSAFPNSSLVMMVIYIDVYDHHICNNYYFCDLNCPSKANLKSMWREDESSLLSMLKKHENKRVSKLL